MMGNLIGYQFYKVLSYNSITTAIICVLNFKRANTVLVVGMSHDVTSPLLDINNVHLYRFHFLFSFTKRTGHKV